MNIVRTMIAAACGALIANPAIAESLQETMHVSATIVGTCTSLSVGALNFGQIRVNGDGTLTGTAAETILTVNCTAGTAITLDAGNGLNHDGSSRAMQGSAGEGALRYNLYRDSAHQMPWGSQSGGSSIPFVTQAGQNGTIIYGNVQGSAAANVGTYTDSVVVTLTF